MMYLPAVYALGFVLFVAITAYLVMARINRHASIETKIAQAAEVEILKKAGFEISASVDLASISLFLQPSFRPQSVQAYVRASDGLLLIEAYLRNVSENRTEPVGLWFLHDPQGSTPPLVLFHNQTTYPWSPIGITNMSLLKLESNQFEWSYEAYVAQNSEEAALQILEPGNMQAIEDLGAAAHIEYGPTGWTIIMPMVATADREKVRISLNKLVGLHDAVQRILPVHSLEAANISSYGIHPRRHYSWPTFLAIISTVLLISPLLTLYSGFYSVSSAQAALLLGLVGWTVAAIGMTWRSDELLAKRRK